MSRSPDSERPRQEAHGPTVPAGFTRRSFLIGAGGVAASGAIGATASASGPPAKEGAGAEPVRLEGTFEVELTLNGERVTVEVEPRTTLLQLLRHRTDPPLTGTKEGCNHGSCGACTVLLDGSPVNACSVLAGNVAGREVTTVEGLGSPDALSPVQRAFCENDAMMCGFCTPGFVVSVTACLEANPAAGTEEIETACAGHICRCGTYPQIVKAAQQAGRELRKEGR